MILLDALDGIIYILAFMYGVPLVTAFSLLYVVQNFRKPSKSKGVVMIVLTIIVVLLTFLSSAIFKKSYFFLQDYILFAIAIIIVLLAQRKLILMPILPNSQLKDVFFPAALVGIQGAGILQIVLLALINIHLPNPTLYYWSPPLIVGILMAFRLQRLLHQEEVAADINPKDWFVLALEMSIAATITYSLLFAATYYFGTSSSYPISIIINEELFKLAILLISSFITLSVLNRKTIFNSTNWQ